MANVKLTKSELRNQQQRLTQLKRYLPTLQLKKAMLQTQVSEARQEIAKLQTSFKQLYTSVETYGELLSDRVAINPEKATEIVEVKKRYENIAGVDVPFFEGVQFAEYTYSLFATPPWVDPVIKGLRTLKEEGVKIEIAKEKKSALEHELRDVSIRVNLFEKILIPRANENIKDIKVFLGDQQLAAVSQAKVAKSKIEERKARVPHAL